MIPTDLPTRRCVCGHDAGAHEHYRPGSDCSVCGEGMCPVYEPRGSRLRVAVDALFVEYLRRGGVAVTGLAHHLARWRDSGRAGIPPASTPTRPRLLATVTDIARTSNQIRLLVGESYLTIKRLEKLMTNVSGLLAEVAAGLRGPLATSITALIAENATLAARNAELEGEDAAESTAAADVKAAFDEVAAKFSATPEVPDVDPLPEPPAPVPTVDLDVPVTDQATVTDQVTIATGTRDPATVERVDEEPDL